MGKYRLIAGALVLACAAITSAAADEGPGDCPGVDFDAAHPITIAKISAEKPRTYFLKSAYDDAACPADTDACRQKTYLIPGDLILLGKTFSDKANTPYTCTAYEKAEAKKVAGRAVGCRPRASQKFSRRQRRHAPIGSAIGRMPPVISPSRASPFTVKV